MTSGMRSSSQFSSRRFRPHRSELVRRYIPTTYLVHKRETPDYWRARCEGKRFVLKESISSGKGTIFSDDPRFADAMSTACGSYYRYVLQEEVINRPRSFDHFGKDGSVHHGEWFMRVTVHYAARRVADIAVTARQDKGSTVHSTVSSLARSSCDSFHSWLAMKKSLQAFSLESYTQVEFFYSCYTPP